MHLSRMSASPQQRAALRLLALGFVAGLLSGRMLPSLSRRNHSNDGRETGADRFEGEALVLPGRQLQQVNLLTQTMTPAAALFEDLLQSNEERVQRMHAQRPFVQVYEDLLHVRGYQQEGAHAVWKGKLIMAGGINYTMFQPETKETDPLRATDDPTLGTRYTTVYDVETRASYPGPELPYRINHNAGCMSPDGVFHLVGGYTQDGPRGHKATDRHVVWRVEEAPEGPWEERARLPFARGAVSCSFIDVTMYCVGGGAGVGGPFFSDLMIYDSLGDKWTIGPSAPTARDHTAAVAVDGLLFVIGGRTTRVHNGRSFFAHWVASDANEVYDPKERVWTSHAPLPYPRAMVSTTVLRREAGSTSLLTVGGEAFMYATGRTFSLMEEYDVATDLWYCWPGLQHPIFGGGTALDSEGRLHVVGGGEAFGISATRRVQIVDVPAAPLPVPCMYEPVLVQHWNRTFTEALPYPYLPNIKGGTRLPMLHYNQRQLNHHFGKFGGREPWYRAQKEAFKSSD